MTSQRLALIGGGMMTLGMMWAAAEGPMTVSAIHTSPQSRAAYLARASIWHDPGVLSPADVFEGPSGALPYTFEQANSDEGIGCTRRCTTHRCIRWRSLFRRCPGRSVSGQSAADRRATLSASQLSFPFSLGGACRCALVARIGAAITSAMHFC
jgi:hypothetical protein